MEKVLTGRSITFEDAERLLGTSDIMPLADCANTITRTFNGDRVDVEALVILVSTNIPYCRKKNWLGGQEGPR
jgi:2-iminoacetate synthase ThiH